MEFRHSTQIVGVTVAFINPQNALFQSVGNLFHFVGGHYLIEELDELELPEEAKKYFMYEEYGRDAAINDGGSFTEQGYIYNNRNTFTQWYDG